MSLLERLPQAVRHEGGLSRRLFVAYGAALAALPALAARSAGTTDSKISFAADPFQLGVASGDPEAHSVVLWTRLCPKPLEPGYGLTTERVSVRWELSETESMSRIIQRGTALALPQLGHSVHVEVAGLKPGRHYWYRFHAGLATSPIGRTRTLPEPDSLPSVLNFAFASCQHYEDGHYTVMLALPLAAVGAFGLLWLLAFLGKTGVIPVIPSMNINLFSQIGLVLLVGLVTKNSILLVEYANQRAQQGIDPVTAMMEAGKVRLRPILMTAFSTVAGIMPIAIGFGAGAESRRPMGVAVVGGMLTSTFLTLYVIPVVYVLLDRWFPTRPMHASELLQEAPTPQPAVAH